MSADELEREVGRLAGAVESLVGEFHAFRDQVGRDVHSVNTKITNLQISAAVQKAAGTLGWKPIAAMIAISLMGGAVGAKGSELMLIIAKALL